jgi:phospholipase C
MRWGRVLGLGAVVAVLATATVLSPSTGRGAQSTSSASAATIPQGIHKIRHIVIIMQENRSFDNYFGTYPGAAGFPMRHGQPAICVPNPVTHNCVKPYHDRQDYNYGGPHDAAASAADINGGKMNGFLAQQEAAVARCHCGTPNPPNDAVGYHTGKELPNYWRYARAFVLQDHMFQPESSWSLPAHLWLVSLWSAHCTSKAPSSCKNTIDRPGNPPGWGHHPKHKPPIYAWTDLTYLLHQHHITWRYYIFRGIEPDCESDRRLTCRPVTQGPKTSPVWNPLRYFETVRRDRQLANIQSLNGFFTAAQRGTLPAVSWIMPNQETSEHPFTLISKGQTYVTGVINTIMQSPEWKSTAIFLTWDDWGGFYDHLRPPRIDRNGYGLQVPALVISPYAKHNYIDHQVLSFDAYAKFIEDDFLGGQRLNPHTDGRPDPRPDTREKVKRLGNLINDFNFRQSPRKPVLLPVHPKTDFIR